MENFQEIKLPNGFVVVPLPSIHRVPSHSYVIYEVSHHLKPNYRGLPGHEIAELRRNHVAMEDICRIPLVAFTGDTSIDIFDNPENADLLVAKTLIIECTFMGEKQSPEKALETGHIHLSQVFNKFFVFYLYFKFILNL